MKTGTKIVIGVVLGGLFLVALASTLLPSRECARKSPSASIARMRSSVCSSRVTSRDAGSTAPAGSLPNADEELWVIQRPKVSKTAADAVAPGCGMLKARFPDEQKEIPLPLKHTDVSAWITGYTASIFSS